MILKGPQYCDEFYPQLPDNLNGTLIAARAREQNKYKKDIDTHTSQNQVKNQKSDENLESNSEDKQYTAHVSGRHDENKLNKGYRYKSICAQY